jgi:hypothetical protein
MRKTMAAVLLSLLPLGSLVPLAALSAVSLAEAGCSSSDSTPAKGTYELDLTGFDPHSGTNVILKVKDTAGTTVYGTVTVAIPASGKAQIVVPGILEDGKQYRVDFFADTDGDGLYKKPSPPNFPEHSWRRVVTGKTSGVTETFAHDSNWTDISPF